LRIAVANIETFFCFAKTNSIKINLFLAGYFNAFIFYLLPSIIGAKNL